MLNIQYAVLKELPYSFTSPELTVELHCLSILHINKQVGYTTIGVTLAVAIKCNNIRQIISNIYAH